MSLTSRRGSATILIAIIVVAAFVAGGGVWWYLSNANRLPQSPRLYPFQLVTSSTTVTPLDNATSSWQIYRDSKYHFSFSYPSDFTIDATHFEVQASDSLPIQPFPAEPISLKPPYESHQSLTFIVKENDTIDNVTVGFKADKSCASKSERSRKGVHSLGFSRKLRTALRDNVNFVVLGDSNILVMDVLEKSTSTSMQDIPEAVVNGIIDSISI